MIFDTLDVALQMANTFRNSMQMKQELVFTLSQLRHTLPESGN